MANIKSSGSKPQIDIEKVRYCDTFLDGDGAKQQVEFLRCFVYKNGVLDADLTNDYEPDGVTAYTVQGDVSRCIEEVKTVFKKYVFKKGVIPAGVSEKYWQFDGTTGNGNGTVAQTPVPPISDIFSEVDECGIMAHPNTPDQENVLSQAIPTDPTGNIAHESELDFWICIGPEEAAQGVQLASRTNGFSTSATYFGTCNGKLVEVSRVENNTAAGTSFFTTDLGSVGAGFFHVRILSHDPHQFGKTSLQWSFDNGATYQNIPTENLISQRPSATCVDVTCDSDGKLYFLDSGEEILEDDYKCFACDPCEVPTGLPQPAADEDVDVELVKLCDKALTGEITKFYRQFTYSDGVLTGTSDVTLDGTAYTPSGIVSDCDKDCNDICAFYNQTITVTDGTIGQLDLSDVDGDGNYCEPNCAKISVVKGSGSFTYHPGGEPSTDITDYVGHPFNECDTIELGCCGGSTGGKDELKEFRVTPNAGEDLILSVTYSRPK